MLAVALEAEVDTCRTTSVQWPEDIDRRLNILVRAATTAGERTSRAELLAALIAAADTQPEQLALLLYRYRRLPKTALADDESREDLPQVRSPGPRRASSA
ncbi:hypothetical protein [Streptomyces odonnellii]|uniref:hypothetical protein n=1 Tax=Streptomyces odonnellii TaxID=1417980 RepID=UPI00062567F7|nr:hypothetical protein [Streptomyces odonnellii]